MPNRVHSIDASQLERTIELLIGNLVALKDSSGEFLLKLGLAARCDSLLRHATEAQRPAVLSGAARLADPGQMGLLFKVLVWQSSGLAPPPPFGDS